MPSVGRAREGVAGVGMPVKEGPAQSRRALECIEHPLGGERRGHREISTSETLAEAEQVGNHILPFAGEHAPRAPESGRDFVENQQGPNPVGGGARVSVVFSSLSALTV